MIYFRVISQIITVQMIAANGPCAMKGGCDIRAVLEVHGAILPIMPDNVQGRSPLPLEGPPTADVASLNW